MRSIATGLILYANESGGRYPDRLEDLLEAEDLNGPSDLVCFSSGDMPATGPTVHDVAINSSTGGHISYVYLGKGMKYPAPPDAVIAYESLSHHGNGMHMLFGDGKVFFVPAAQAQQILQQVNAGINPPTMPAGVGR